MFKFLFFGVFFLMVGILVSLNKKITVKHKLLLEMRKEWRTLASSKSRTQSTTGSLRVMVASAARGPVPRVRFVERKRETFCLQAAALILLWAGTEDAQNTQPIFCLSSRSKRADGDIISKADVRRGGQSGDG